MSLSARDVARLKKPIESAKSILTSNEEVTKASRAFIKSAKPSMVRLNGKVLVLFQKMLKAERKRGVRVSEISRNRGVSTAYVDMIR